jgi:hypothetical protein
VKTLATTKEQWNSYAENDFALYLFDTTKWISYTLAPSSRYCYLSGLEVWEFVELKQE